MHKNIEIIAAGKIAEFAKFAGGERRMSPDLICLIEQSELRMEDFGLCAGVECGGAEAERDAT